MFAGMVVSDEVAAVRKLSEAPEKPRTQFFSCLKLKTATYPIAKPYASGNIVIYVYT